jgi:hypothetical protein
MAKYQITIPEGKYCGEPANPCTALIILHSAGTPGYGYLCGITARNCQGEQTEPGKIRAVKCEACPGKV